MKFRIIFDSKGNEITIITEDGGIACVRGVDSSDDQEPRISVTEYYQSKISNDMNSDNLFELLAEGKMYSKDWADIKYNSLTTIQDALNWLSVGQNDWEMVNDLFPHIFNIDAN